MLKNLAALLTSRRFLVMLAGIFAPPVARKLGLGVDDVTQALVTGGAAAWAVAESLRRHERKAPTAS